MMFVTAAAALLVTMALALGRALLGPTVYDRILAVNMIGTKTVLLIAVLGFLNGRPDFMDISLLYALINFTGMLAVLKFIRVGHLGGQEEPATAPIELPETADKGGADD